MDAVPNADQEGIDERVDRDMAYWVAHFECLASVLWAKSGSWYRTLDSNDNGVDMVALPKISK